MSKFFKFNKYTQGSFGPQYRVKAATANFGSNYNLNRFNTPTDDLTRDSVIEEWLPKNPILLNKLFRIVHRFDSIAGPAVDLISIMPFSDVTLVGVNDPEILKVYEQTVAELHVETLLPEIAAEFLVIGRVIGSLLFDSKRGIWTDIVLQDPDYCEITNIPLRGHDPKIDMKVSDDFKKFLYSKDPRDEDAKKDIPKNFLEQLERYEIIPLDPVSTLYLPRRTYPSDFIGSSIYYRILPFFALEKCLINGTLIAAKRRQRSILHVTVGETDLWEPEEDDISTIAGMFMQADEDPQGAIVATRKGVETNEVRCLSGDTLISTEKGLIEIDKIISNFDPVKEKPVTLPIDVMVKGLDGKYVKADKWRYQGIKPVFNYYTTSGYKINCTENHKILTLGEFANLELIKAGEVGDSYICIENDNKNIINNKLLLNLTIPESINMNRKFNYSISMPKYMTPELAYLFGITVAEGSIGTKSIEIVNTDEQIVEKIKKCFKEVFNKDPSVRINLRNTTVIKGSSYVTKPLFVVTVSSKLIISIFNQLGMLSTNCLRSKNSENSPSYYKEIPWSIFQADRQSQLSFLASYIDGDGSTIDRSNSVHKALEIYFCSTSKKILNSIKILLSSMGYYSNIQENRVYIGTSNGSRLYNELLPYLSCMHKKKHEMCGFPRSRQMGIPSDAFIPFLVERQIKRVKNGTLFKTDDGKEVLISGGWRKVFRHYAFSNSYMLYDSYKEGKYEKELNIIKQVSYELYNNLISIFKAEYRFEKIFKVEDAGLTPCYDISIEDGSPPIFVADGILVKNSGSDFWKISDEWDFLSTAKMRALGINESFLSGDATYNCVVGDSLIPTEKGLLRIDEISNGEEGSIKDIDIKVGSRYGISKAVKWLNNGVADVFRLETEYGNEIECTPKHSFLVLKNNRLKWISANDIQIGDMICLNTKKIVRKDKLKLELYYEDSLGWRPRGDIKVPEYMTPELAYIMGCLVSEGSLKNDETIFYNGDEDYIKKYIDCVKEVFGINCSKTINTPKGTEKVIKGKITHASRDCYIMRTYNQTLVNWLKKLGLEEDIHALQKTIPWSILQADEESQLAFLAAYLEGDGSITNGKVIRYFSSSHKLLSQLQIMLNSHGLFSTKVKYSDINAIVLGNIDSYTLWKGIGKYMVSKQYLKEYNEEDIRKGYRFVSDYIREFLDGRKVKGSRTGVVFRADSGEDLIVKNWSKDGVFRNKMFLYDVYNKGGYNKFLNIFEKISKEEHDNLVEILNFGCRFAAISEKEYVGKKPVYDLSMTTENEPVYVSCCFISHNTMEVALSVFVETLRNFRDYLVSKIFYEKLFPIIAEIHGFKKRTQAELAHGIRLKADSPDSSLIIPQLNFHKQLRPEADASYMEVLSMLEEKGFYIPMRVWSAAGGLNIDNIFDMRGEDIKNRRFVNEWKKSIGDTGGGEEEEDAQNAWGSFVNAEHKVIKSSLDSLPIWIKNKFFGIDKSSIMQVIKSSNPKTKLMSKFKDDPKKIEAANYILKRMGLNIMPFDVGISKEIAEHLKKCSNKFSKMQIKNEFIALNKIISKARESGDKLIENIDDNRSKESLPVNKNLYSGIKK